ncbi:poly-beta-1,6-N-acetyl-D-glucosamine synthase [Xylophilus sp. Leaf220]|uniref:poly-beta-1,6-N-acetyl-D-glucosamine synthase n=1 Tax=Xylophilus sp. Leaf220 TaxID=1735686 RepID=UPI0006F78EDB|nr:poly-beta-1,6-N-acetyl-D-glucosamine synthase [Xylophilus sp. Leaf220]KQM69790.1 poly-beta-1,6 N-acetyl-D-glucosamine synthase [Xylophilus sp. Leaf220]
MIDSLETFLGVGLPTLVFGYVFYYPFFMAYLWMAGGISHALAFERGDPLEQDPLTLLPSLPVVSILVPCFNEGTHAREVLEQVMRTRYPYYEVIAINDGSTDDTGAVLDELARTYPQLRVVHHAQNQGKAVGLNTATALARGEFILGIDGDALLDRDAIAWLLRHLLTSDGVGAVTGNPRIRTRTTLIGRMQVGEFSSTIGLIKRTQQILGRLFTVSGVITMFRRKALLDVGFWSTDMMTEDIDVTWKLQMAQWRVRFEPRAMCWILMPESIRGLYRQRQRWATGGIQTLMRYGLPLLRPRHWRMWPVFLEYVASVVWAYAMFALLLTALVHYWLPDSWIPEAWQVGIFPAWRGTLLGLTCMLQMLVSLWIDRHYDRSLLRYFLWTVWYPIAFWTITMVTTVLALPLVLMRRRGKRATWTSPDRGNTHAS